VEVEKIEKENLKPFDVILLDLGLPDSAMDKTLSRMLPYAKDTPIVVLSSLDDEEFGSNVIHQGAQNFISKSWIDGELLYRALRYAIERNAVVQELRKANRTKDEFLATLSHELWTPINVIHGFAEMLLAETLPQEEKKQAIDAIVRNARVQVSLINDMLDMSRIITGKFLLQSMPQNLSEVISDVMASLNLAARTRKIYLDIKNDKGSIFINGDPVRLHQIFWNILSNAIKFSPIGSHVEVRLKSLESSVVIEIQDWGEGIDPRFLPFIFDRFSQQDTSIRRQYGGLGLGLSIVKYLVELHGGEITATSQGTGKGSLFTVQFPKIEEITSHDIEALRVTNQSATPSYLVERKTENENSQLPSIKDIHVLVIDDSIDSLILTKILLQRLGAVVTTASSSAKALELLEELKPDVIVCDIGMPEEDGYTFLKKYHALEAKKNRRPIPATALTAYTRDEEKKQAFQIGFQSHLSKPVEETALVKTIFKLSHLEI
jgi:signal transduction histidine kinase/ActR/RegA family two-component response regulator